MALWCIGLAIAATDAETRRLLDVPHAAAFRAGSSRLLLSNSEGQAPVPARLSRSRGAQSKWYVMGAVQWRPPPASDPSTWRRMTQQRRGGTRPEVAVRRLLHALGHRFRIGNRDLPGSPDIANRSRKWAVFVHGCYWHGHAGCERATVPKRHREFWLQKFRENRARDVRKGQELEDLGYRVSVFWECECDDLKALRTRLRRAVPSPAQPKGRAIKGH